MKTRHDIVWDNATLQGASAPLTQKVFGNSVCGVRIQNRSVWVLMVTETATGAPVEELPPFSWVLIPNPVDYTFQLLVANNNLTKPADMRVSVTYVDTPVTYAYGSISPLSGQSIPLSGIDSASNGVNVNNTVGTDIGKGFTRLSGGGTMYASSGGITVVTFSSVAQQVVLLNQGSANVSFWGDEDGGSQIPADAPILLPGGSFSLAWSTLHIYLSSNGTNIPVQVQGWS